MLVNERYANAFSEVLEILFCVPEIEYRKLPPKLIQILEENCNPNYEFYYDPEKSLDEQNTLEETKDIIALIYRDYWANEEQKREIIDKEKEELQNIEKQKSEQYSYEKLFQNNRNKKISDTSKNELIVVKDSFFTQILKKIKQFFSRYQTKNNNF